MSGRTNLEVGWTGAKKLWLSPRHRRTSSSSSESSIVRWNVREPNLLAWRIIPLPAGGKPKRTRMGIVEPSPRWTTFPAAWRVASIVVGGNRSFRWKRWFDVRDRRCRSWTIHLLYLQPRRREVVWEKAGPSIGGGWKHSYDVVQQRAKEAWRKYSSSPCWSFRCWRCDDVWASSADESS